MTAKRPTAFRLPRFDRTGQDGERLALRQKITRFYECLALLNAYPMATHGRARAVGINLEIAHLDDDGVEISQCTVPASLSRTAFHKFQESHRERSAELRKVLLETWSLVTSDERGNIYKREPVTYISEPASKVSDPSIANLLKPMLTDWVKKNTVAEDGIDTVQFSEMSALQEIESAKKAFAENSAHLTAADWQVLAAEAERRATANKTVAELAAAPDRPMLYRDRPRGQDLVSFLRAEYKNKGFLTPELNRGVLATFDPQCLKAIEDYEQKRSLLPEDVSIPKLRARRNFRQRQPS